MIAFGLSPSWPLGMVALLGVGVGFLTVVATSNTSIQTIVADHMRGRVMATRVMGFTAAYPLGALIQGTLSDHVGPRATVTGAGLMLLVIACWLATRTELLAHLDDGPDRTASAVA